MDKFYDYDMDGFRKRFAAGPWTRRKTIRMIKIESGKKHIADVPRTGTVDSESSAILMMYAPEMFDMLLAMASDEATKEEIQKLLIKIVRDLMPPELA